jgi:tetratricopeptide (TPR) repeat protein
VSRTPLPSSGEEDESFRLAEKLAEELGTEGDSTESGGAVLDVESVFQQFKKGVAEQIGLEDSDTHFDLGIAYKEMGLLDDAIGEFDLARQNPQRECIAFTMMGICFVEKGEIADAISHFKKGLYAEAKTDREELGLYFELGQAYELMHDAKEALYYYQKVQKREPEFRNVGDRIKALASPQGKAAAPEEPEPEMDDVDRAFDDLMGDDN